MSSGAATARPPLSVPLESRCSGNLGMSFDVRLLIISVTASMNYACVLEG